MKPKPEFLKAGATGKLPDILDNVNRSESGRNGRPAGFSQQKSMPALRAAAMSEVTLSPTKRTSAAATPISRKAGSKIRGSGLAIPTSSEMTTDLKEPGDGRGGEPPALDRGDAVGDEGQRIASRPASGSVQGPRRRCGWPDKRFEIEGADPVQGQVRQVELVGQPAEALDAQPDLVGLSALESLPDVEVVAAVGRQDRFHPEADAELAEAGLERGPLGPGIIEERVVGVEEDRFVCHGPQRPCGPGVDAVFVHQMLDQLRRGRGPGPDPDRLAQALQDVRRPLGAVAVDGDEGLALLRPGRRPWPGR